MIVIAGRQQACFVLAHDAAHYRLYKSRWLNDLVGRMLAAPVGLSMRTYRVLHRLHHNHLYEERDPDIPLVAGYPRGRKYLAKKLIADLFGLNAWKTYAYFFGAPAINDDAQGPTDRWTIPRPISAVGRATGPLDRRRVSRWRARHRTRDRLHTGIPPALACPDGDNPTTAAALPSHLRARGCTRSQHAVFRLSNEFRTLVAALVDVPAQGQLPHRAPPLSLDPLLQLAGMPS